MEEMSLGAFIASKRESLGLSQRDLAKKLQISNASIARIENGTVASPDPAILRKVAEALNVDYNYLLVLNKTIDDDGDDIREIARASKNMSPELRRDMMNLLRKEFAEAFSDDN